MVFSLEILIVILSLQSIRAAEDNVQVITLGYVSWEIGVPGYTIPGVTIDGYTIDGNEIPASTVPGTTVPGWTSVLSSATDYYLNPEAANLDGATIDGSDNGQGLNDGLYAETSVLSWEVQMSGETIPGTTIPGTTIPGSTILGSTIPGTIIPGSSYTLTSLDVMGAMTPAQQSSYSSLHNTVGGGDEESTYMAPSVVTTSLPSSAAGPEDTAQGTPVSLAPSEGSNLPTSSEQPNSPEQTNTAQGTSNAPEATSFSRCNEGETCITTPLSTLTASDEVEVLTYVTGG